MAERMVKYRITRYDAATNEPARQEEFRVRFRKGMSVLEGLLEIQERQDGSLALRYSCRSGMCGSCAMRINGRVCLACRTQVETLGRTLICVEPLPHLKVVKDLIVDMGPFFANYERIRPWLVCDGSLPERERVMYESQRQQIAEYIKCNLCAACHGRCPVVWCTSNYLGPASLAKAYRFIADVRDADAERRLKELDSHCGVWGCDSVFNCVRVCPQGVPPAHSITAMRRMLLRRAGKRLFGG